VTSLTIRDIQVSVFFWWTTLKEIEQLYPGLRDFRSIIARLHSNYWNFITCHIPCYCIRMANYRMTPSTERSFVISLPNFSQSRIMGSIDGYMELGYESP
jgi:hypothetical protein